MLCSTITYFLKNVTKKSIVISVCIIANNNDAYQRVQAFKERTTTQTAGVLLCNRKSFILHLRRIIQFKDTTKRVISCKKIIFRHCWIVAHILPTKHIYVKALMWCDALMRLGYVAKCTTFLHNTVQKHFQWRIGTCRHSL